MLTRKLTIVAKDPAMCSGGKMLRAQVEVASEKTDPGPRGYRVHVIDYDSSQKVLYQAAELDGGGQDKFQDAADGTLLTDPAFHAQNVYATVMKQLARFEFALGRAISWGFNGHQLYVFPHAFADKNAFYSEENHSLVFGYFLDCQGEKVFTCLSHDIIAHESGHALLSGLRNSYTLPSSPDQAAFHEGFADLVALLSVFAVPAVVRSLLAVDNSADTISRDAVEEQALRDNALLGLAAQFGKAISGGREEALRNAAVVDPDPTALDTWLECHLRSTILSGAVLRAFVGVWVARLSGWMNAFSSQQLPLDRVVEDGCDAAEHLLTMAIRALDFCPVVDLQFGDFLSALLTADYEVLPSDGKYRYRDALRRCFAEWKILPTSTVEKAAQVQRSIQEEGVWETPLEAGTLDCTCVHLESLMRDPDEVFRFLWANRAALEVYDQANTRVLSVRPCTRVGPDGFVLHETVSEYLQTLEMSAGELEQTLGIKQPAEMPAETPVRILGGGVLLFDEFGRLKYHIRSRLNATERQQTRLAYLWENGVHDAQGRYGFTDGAPRGLRFALAHLQLSNRPFQEEEWNA